MDMRLYEGDEQTPLTDLPTDDEQATDPDRDNREGGDRDTTDDRDVQVDDQGESDSDSQNDDLEDDITGMFG